MAYKIAVSTQAKSDLAEVFDYLRERSPDAAAHWYKRVRNAFNTLTQLPERCAHAPEAARLRIEIRQLLYGQPPGIYRNVFESLVRVRKYVY